MHPLHRFLQLSGSALANAGANGSPTPPGLFEEGCNSTATNATSACMQDDGGSIDIVGVFIPLAAGLASVAAIVVICYVCFLLIDRFFWRDVTNVDRSYMAAQAGLYGLLVSERQRILTHLFEEKAFSYGDGLDVEGGTRDSAEEIETQEKEKEGQGEHDEPPEEETVPTDVNGEATEAHITHDYVEHDKVCCICLNEYVPESQVVQGSTCVHVFHAQCCLQWLQKHDHCPYCRKSMFTRQEMYEAAVDVLGQARVEELKLPQRDLEMATMPRMETDTSSGENAVEEAETAQEPATEEEVEAADDDAPPAEAQA